MSGSQQNLTKQQVLDATKQPPVDGDFVWDDQDENERPLTKPEMRTAIKLGRPKADVTKERITLRVSREVSEFFRATGKGWQTRMNAALVEYVKTHR
jgi:uncharacterized protein (DUF4415 family)